MLKSRGVNARRETERSSDSDSDDGKIPTLDEEEREELFKDDFSFDIRSDLLGGFGIWIRLYFVFGLRNIAKISYTGET